MAGRYPVDFGEIQLSRDPDRSSGWLIATDGVAQSYVDLDDPTYLEFDYIQRIADVIDCFSSEVETLSAVYIGGGACTLPRYIAATHPGSRHLVFEIDGALIELMRDQLELRSVPNLRVRIAGGSKELPELRTNSADVIIVDAFDRATMPAQLATGEFVSAAQRVLNDSGVYLVNLADSGDLIFAKRCTATLLSRFDQVMLLAEPGILRGRRFGNLVLAGADTELPVSEITRKTVSAAFPARCLSGAELRAWCGRQAPFDDVDSVVVPAPPAAALGIQARRR